MNVLIDELELFSYNFCSCKQIFSNIYNMIISFIIFKYNYFLLQKDTLQLSVKIYIIFILHMYIRACVYV